MSEWDRTLRELRKAAKRRDKAAEARSAAIGDVRDLHQGGAVRRRLDQRDRF